MNPSLLSPEPVHPERLHSVPFVSVVVPVRNEEAFLRQTLEQLFEQDYDPERYEVLVADGASTDGTVAIVQELRGRFANLRLLHNPRRWASAGRNLGIGAARGELIVIVDGHCQLSGRDYLTKLADAFRKSGAACVGRPQPLDISGATPLQRAIASARSCWLGHHPDSHIYSTREQLVRPQSVAIAYRRSVFELVGLFDEAFDACEDVEFNHRVERAQLSCFFTPAVAVHYRPRATLAGLFRQLFRYGRGRVRLLRKHPETFSPLGFLPALLVFGLVAGSVLAWWSPLLALLYGGTVGGYALTLLLAGLVLAIKEREPWLLGWLPLVLAALHLGAGAGLLIEAVLARRSRRAAVCQDTYSVLSRKRL